MTGQFFSIEEAERYLSERSEKKRAKNDLVHLLANNDLRLCFTFQHELVKGDDDFSSFAKCLGYDYFKGYLLYPSPHIDRVKEIVSWPYDQLVTVIAGDKVYPYQRFDGGDIEAVSYFLADTTFLIDDASTIGKRIGEIEECGEKLLKFIQHEVRASDLLIPASDVEAVISRNLSTAPAPYQAPSYTTRLLEIQASAIKNWWITYDPEDPATTPDKSAIIDWLTAEKGCSQQQAQAIDLIIRHDSRKNGGAKPKG